ncbi:hypothetical protein JAAARDRAFT_42778 [Jaapia argillacea MUCL 33604]|uniref:MYND-type domain-containing protein n=1 Tax=Jaapia argillacea MUCL 33604 TaxID=933084 RepID=A0A067PGE7_9AGAM|nr:hypothetical protein JAAARDRAFT_42778 [Jaapia argillacea MUCL 33604]
MSESHTEDHRHGVDENGVPTCACAIPEAPRARHPESNPKQTARKGLTQCQHCYKSQGGGVNLKKCGACGMAMYCSPECQKKAWPSHKVKCKLNQRSSTTVAYSDIKLLRAFTAKHRPSLASYGLRALDLVLDPTRCLRDVLLINLANRPDSARSETSFYALSAEIVPLEFFESNTEEMRGQLVQLNEEQKKLGMTGSFFVVLRCDGGDKFISNIAPVTFERASLRGLRPGMPWKAELMRKLNEGIIM